MTFKVVSTAAAEGDVKEIVAFVSKQSIAAAARWLFGFEDILKNLSEFPLRFAVISENQSGGVLYRSYLYHSHRIIYRVDETNSSDSFY